MKQYNSCYRYALLLGMLLIEPIVQAAEVKVAVAANFTDVARELVPLFKQTTGHTASISFGSTGKLYAQIGNGAPFGVFLAADSERAWRTEASGLAVEGTRFTYAVGRLVFWSSTSGQFNEGESYLRSASFKRVAIGNPKTAPYGHAAKQVLEHLSLWSEVEPKLVRGESIAQTFQFTATGNVDAGFVALSQVKGWRERGTLWTIPQKYYSPIEQQAVLLSKGRDNPAAIAFVDFLRSVAARKVISSYGYGVE
ncbi:molybdate ABC transporter substrate-binding protein [Solemya pervernicosa gill symbiont]|uniref:Molybdate ABC transporter substrate-binding protein n=1 Tax=Solemya pervernicosa gill symbiont TaxID=642797 RepID=A0A1T2L2I2_9GAMM|nr:molybdate ABC transporter substrate-binding protein [Solemya pervernicosa gill symbiont]OOZ39240.1 molybdate ABC transporter substrate-binding protein [Solemya pervernicosa gill symbiont]